MERETRPGQWKVEVFISTRRRGGAEPDAEKQNPPKTDLQKCSGVVVFPKRCAEEAESAEPERVSGEPLRRTRSSKHSRGEAGGKTSNAPSRSRLGSEPRVSKRLRALLCGVFCPLVRDGGVFHVAGMDDHAVPVA